MGWAARKNPRSLEGKADTDAVFRERLRAVVADCSGELELAAYVSRTFGDRTRAERRQIFATMRALAPAEWSRPTAVLGAEPVPFNPDNPGPTLADAAVRTAASHPYSATCECEACDAEYKRRRGVPLQRLAPDGFHPGARNTVTLG